MDATKLVRYEMTKEDFIAFNIYHQDHSPSLTAQRRSVIAVFILFAVVLGAIPLLLPRTELLWVLAATLAGLACYIPSSYRKTIRKLVGRMLDEGQNKGVLGLKEITLSPVEIGITGALRSATVRWPAVEKVVTTDEALYVYISSVEAIIIPRRAFEKPEEFDGYVAAARKYQAEAAARSK